MGFFDKFLSKEKTQDITVKSPYEIFTDMLKVTSGSDYSRDIKYDIFYRIIAFKGVCDGVGVSTLVSNVAVVLAELGLTVCVIDSSILTPAQDVLLKTNWQEKEMKHRLDWFDMMFTNNSVLNQSKRNKNISVLSFKGKDRDITDMVGTKDNEELVTTAIVELENKFDVILIDCCQEATRINTACLQQAKKVIQVWSDSPHIISNIQQSITNNIIMSCPLDKMRYVVLSKYVGDIQGVDFESILKKHKLVKLGGCKLSMDVARANAMGKCIWNYTSDSADITEFNECVISIVKHLLNILDENDAKGTITSNDISDGNVEGTLTKKYVERDKKIDEIVEKDIELF